MIAFNYNEAVKQANKLEQISEELQNLIEGTLKNWQSELECTWKGDSAQIYLQRTEKLYKDINQTAKITSAVATAVRISAKNIKVAEDAASQMVKTVRT